MGLTDKREKFVQGLIKGKSQRQAYIEAGYSTKNLSENAIDVEASKLLKIPKVSLRYNELKNRLIQEAENECIVSAKDVLRELSAVAFADIKDYLSYRSEQTENGFAPVIELKNSEDVPGAAIKKVTLTSKGTFAFELHDKMKPLELLYDYFGLSAHNKEKENDVVDDWISGLVGDGEDE